MPRKSEKPSTSRVSKAGPSTSKVQRRKRQISSSSDEDYKAASTKNKPRNSSFVTQQENTADIPTLTTNMVKYLLNHSFMKYQIKRPDINKSLNIHPKVFPEVFQQVKRILGDVYGLAITDVSDAKNNSAFILHSIVSNGISALQFPSEQRSEILLLFLILSYIFMKGGEVMESKFALNFSSIDDSLNFLLDHLTQFLEQLNIDTQETHKSFGDVGKLIKDKFPRQMYLKRTKVIIEGVNEAQIHLSWGARADVEFDMKDVLNAVAEIMNRSPVTFINQHHAATQGTEQPGHPIECD